MTKADYAYWRLYIEANEMARKEYDRVSARDSWPLSWRFRRKTNLWH